MTLKIGYKVVNNVATLPWQCSVVLNFTTHKLIYWHTNWTQHQIRILFAEIKFPVSLQSISSTPPTCQLQRAASILRPKSEKHWGQELDDTAKTKTNRRQEASDFRQKEYNDIGNGFTSKSYCHQFQNTLFLQCHQKIPTRIRIRTKGRPSDF